MTASSSSTTKRSAILASLFACAPRALVLCVWLSDMASRGPGPTGPLFPPKGRGLRPRSRSHMRKQPNGTPGKKPSAPSVKVRLGRKQ
jgi:hypothetical protein